MKIKANTVPPLFKLKTNLPSNYKDVKERHKKEKDAKIKENIKILIAKHTKINSDYT